MIPIIFGRLIKSLPNKWLSKETSWAYPSLMKCLHDLMDKFLIMGLDKAPNNASFNCKKLAYITAQKRLNGAEFYTCSLDPSEFITRILDDLRYRKIQSCFQILPVLFPTFKIHKNKFRWISNAAQCVFTEVTSIITYVLNLVLDVFHDICAEKQKQIKTFLGVDCNPFWVVKNATEVFLNFPEKIFSLYTADITQCCENIPLQGTYGLMNILLKVCDLAFNNKKKKGFEKVSLFHKTPRWVRKTNLEFPLTVDSIEIYDLITWLLNRTLIHLGSQVYSQKQGIPMGFSCSPVMCNLYFAFLEYSFYCSLAEKGDVNTLKSLGQCFRYMDDVLNINCPNFDKIIAHIYSTDIICIEPTFKDFILIDDKKFVTKTIYLNMELSLISPFSGDFQTCYSWKRELLPIIPTEFVKKNSNRPFIQARNTILSSFHLILYSCIDAWQAYEGINKIANKFSSNGFHKGDIISLFIDRLVTQDWPGLRCQPSSLITILRL